MTFVNPYQIKILIFIFVLTALTAILNFGPLYGLSNTTNALLNSIIGILFVLTHGSLTLGWRNLIAFLVITVLVSFISESIGVATGYVFGQYYYTDHLGPKILGVPFLVQIAYVTMGYMSLMTARVILGLTKPIAQKKSLLALIVIATLIMVGWDVAMDPYQSTVSGDWIWKEGGPYFGVGIHNYVGWFVTVFVFLFLYHVYTRNRSEPNSVIKFSKLFWSLPVIYYGLRALEIVCVPIVGGVSLPYASPANYTGSLNTLMYSLSLIAFFVMGMPVAIAIARLSIDKKNGIKREN